MPQTMTTTAFLGTIGVDTRIADTDGAYANIATIISDLDYLGITHVRDGLSDGEYGSAALASYIQVAQSGIHFTFVTAAGGDQTNATLNAKIADNGANLILTMKGPAVTGAVSIGNPGAGYTKIVAGVDLDGNGTSDLVVQDRTTGTIIGYTLDDTATITVGALLGTPGAAASLIGSNPISFIDGSVSGLVATPGQDQFVMTAATDGLHRIAGFDAARDTFALSAAVFPDYATVQLHEAAYSSGTFIDLSPTSAVVIAGVTPDQLNAANFVLR
jgi:hypothetical protein